MLKLPLKTYTDITPKVAKHLNLSQEVVNSVVKFKFDVLKEFVDDPTSLLPNIGVRFAHLGAFKTELGRINAYIRYVLLPIMRSAKASKSVKYDDDAENFRRVWLLRQFLIRKTLLKQPFDKRKKSVINEPIRSV